MKREELKKHLESNWFQKTIVTVILINSILIGLETDPTYLNSVGKIIDKIDLFILGLFVIEIAIKIYVYRLDFFKSAWNIFDTIVVVVSIIPAAGSFAVFRALRILRTLRLLKNIPKLKLIIESLLHAVPSLGWIFVLLGIVYFVYAVIGVNLFGDAYPEFFGSIGDSFFTLFQIMTLESWSTGIARPIIDNSPFATLYFVSFILLATYTTLNIFIAIVVNTMNELHHKDIVQEEEHIKEFVKNENDKIAEKLDKLDKKLTILNRRLEENESEETPMVVN